MNCPQKLFDTIICCFVRVHTKYLIWVMIFGNQIWILNRLYFDFFNFVFFLRIWQQTPSESLKFTFVLPIWNLNRFTLYTFVLHANGVSSAFLPISCQWPHDRPIEAFSAFIFWPPFLGHKVRPSINRNMKTRNKLSRDARR